MQTVTLKQNGVTEEELSDPLFRAAAPARVGGASVTFEPGARTTWHTHPLGQTLIVTAGRPFGALGGEADQSGARQITRPAQG